MTTWTDSAKSVLDGHLAQMRENLLSSGADPAEVTDDLRRHIDQELAARKIGVVTTEDVESILQRIGLPPAPLNGHGRRERDRFSRPEVIHPRRDEPIPPPKPAPKKHRLLLVFGVVLPLLTLVLECLTHMCASAFFDPIPGWLDILLVASVPVINWLMWNAARRGEAPVPPWLAAASAFSIAVSAYYAILYATLAPFAAIAIIFFGWGLLPLSPIFAFACALRLRALAQPQAEDETRLEWKWGLGAALLALGLIVLPPVLTRQWSHTVANGDTEESARALGWLRGWGHERTLRMDCYGTTRWAQDNPFKWHAQGTPVPAEMARSIYYRVTGHAFNEYAPPQLSYGSRGWDVLGEFEWDSDQGGASVGGRLRGLSLGQSRLDGLIDGDAGWAYTEWVMEFKNVAQREREARTEIVLPPGGVVSRVTLWVNGEEREAAFAGSGAVRAAYQQVVRVYRRDPILVTQVGEDRVLMQCYPVPANGGTIKVRLGITAPLEMENASTAILRWPRFSERNFGVPSGMKHSVWLESSQALTATHPRMVQDHSKPGTFALRGTLQEDELSQTSALVRVPRSANVAASWVADPHGREGQFIRQTLVDRTPAPPERVVLVVDSSKAMDDLLPQVARALNHLPNNLEFSLLLAGDSVEEFSGAVRRTDAAFLQSLSERLARVRAVGGQNNLPALMRALDLAGGRPNGVVVWIHGPQPVKFDEQEALQQRLIWRRPGSGGTSPAFYDLQVSPGANRLVEDFARLAPRQELPRYGSVEEDLQRLFALWRGEAKVLGWNRERLRAAAMPEEARGQKSSKHLARLWAREEVGRLVDNRQREEAVHLAAEYQLVTPVSGAVVLETQQQFQQAGLQPVSPDSVPAVPEPGTMAILIVGAALAIAPWIKRRLRIRQINRDAASAS